MAGEDVRQRRGLPLPGHPGAGGGDPLPSQLRGGEPPLLRAPQGARRLAAGGGVRQGDRPAVRHRGHGAAALRREVRLPAHAPLDHRGPRPAGRHVRDYGWRLRGRWNGMGGVVGGVAREAAAGLGGGVHHRALLGLLVARGAAARWSTGWSTRAGRCGASSGRCSTATSPPSTASASRRPSPEAPSSAFLADGSEVTVSQGMRVE